MIGHKTCYMIDSFHDPKQRMKIRRYPKPKQTRGDGLRCSPSKLGTASRASIAAAALPCPGMVPRMLWSWGVLRRERERRERERSRRQRWGEDTDESPSNSSCRCRDHILQLLLTSSPLISLPKERKKKKGHEGER